MDIIYKRDIFNRLLEASREAKKQGQIIDYVRLDTDELRQLHPVTNMKLPFYDFNSFLKAVTEGTVRYAGLTIRGMGSS